MELIRGLHNIKSHHRGCLLAIGNFDGFHRGHQALISQLNKKKINYKRPVMVMIFEPQPKEYFSKIITIRLTRFRDKVQYLFTAGVDIVLCVGFNKKLASIKAYNFVKEILIYKLGVRCVCVGNDFRFGAFRHGDYNFLKTLGKHKGFKVICADTCLDSYGKKISSTLVKTALIENRIVDAEFLMGHSYCISGKVIHGNELGRIIGFPTANISLKGKNLPVHGVYAVKVYGILHFPLPGIANIGTRPTINGVTQHQLEVHILNISTNLYSYYITVVILDKIRNEQCFNSIHKLQRQIKYDIDQVNNYFKKLS
ncbi:riboflavin biosynthesis protein RibF [Candidatus Blochmanniella floridana]|uniref:Riboflavin biosynthesis protein n=1 Tax=Blochmanniella floridana TaxID=203907 RepID=Q7VQL1_BLOFL|nr:riboflavin biosynthesis protein RibF [Candidatus Blochmannia floridanus]